MTGTPPAAPAAGGQPGWRPENEVERALIAALGRNDGQTYFRLLSAAELYLPRDLADPADNPRLLGVALFGQTFIPAFTSPAALANVFGAIVDGCAVTNYAELRRKWPDPDWRLAVNPGTPIDAYVTIDAVERAATGDLEIPMALDVVAAEMAREDAEPTDQASDSAPLLQAAAARSDVDEYVRVLLDAVLTVPTLRDVTDPAELFEPSFPWVPRGSPPTITIYTSVEAYRRLAGGTGPTLPVVGGFLFAAWPRGCSLSLDPGTTHGIELAEDEIRALVLWPDDADGPIAEEDSRDDSR